VAVAVTTTSKSDKEDEADVNAALPGVSNHPNPIFRSRGFSDLIEKLVVSAFYAEANSMKTHLRQAAEVRFLPVFSRKEIRKGREARESALVEDLSNPPATLHEGVDGYRCGVGVA
jgi:hypothetical protein